MLNSWVIIKTLTADAKLSAEHFHSASHEVHKNESTIVEVTSRDSITNYFHPSNELDTHNWRSWAGSSIQFAIRSQETVVVVSRAIFYNLLDILLKPGLLLNHRLSWFAPPKANIFFVSKTINSKDRLTVFIVDASWLKDLSAWSDHLPDQLEGFSFTNIPLHFAHGHFL